MMLIQNGSCASHTDIISTLVLPLVGTHAESGCGFKRIPPFGSNTYLKPYCEQNVLPTCLPDWTKAPQADRTPESLYRDCLMIKEIGSSPDDSSVPKAIQNILDPPTIIQIH
ncbi:hypothetical protein E4T56_gene18256 [Termitomyces sp. T112]|nr:hypothetical protein E4T56_gene18256 [Termitomyces sp. T112]